MGRVPFRGSEPPKPMLCLEPAIAVPPIVTDPRITYLFAIPGDTRGASVFQGFNEGLLRLHWAFGAMTGLPATIFEPVADPKSLIALRVCGIAGWRHRPLPAEVIPAVPITKAHPFFVVFSDNPDVSEGIAQAFAGQSVAPFHISSEAVPGAFQPDKVKLRHLRDHYLRLIDQNPALALEEMRRPIAAWKPKRQVRSTFDFKGNYTVLPNQMTLRSLGVVPRREVADWSSDHPQDYTAAILESADAVDRFRLGGEIDDTIRLMPPRPDVWIVSPSLMPGFSLRLDLDTVPVAERPAVRHLFRLLGRQRVFGTRVTEDQDERLQGSETVTELKLIRNLEAKTFAAAVGCASAGSVASVYRLAPAVERVAGRVRQFSESFRAKTPAHPGKLARLFADIQSHLGREVPTEISQRLADATWGIRAVTDAPVEWLPVNGLPLSLLRDVSRIPATPGDLTVKLLAEHEPIRIPIRDFSDVLVISAFEGGERFDMMRKGFDANKSDWADRINVKFVRVATEDEFVKALAAYRGPLLIFDGHGTHPRGGRGKLILGKGEIDVWSLMGKVRVPPIVMLSACDTHAADRSWSSVSNAFLHLGARTVLATMLPIGVREGAVFAARFLFRLAAFLPAAVRARGRVVRWSEVVGGMLRMQLLTDILKPALDTKRIEWTDYQAVMSKANLFANDNGQMALEQMERDVLARGLFSAEEFRDAVSLVIPQSDTIRYAQMGSPETILIGSVGDMPEPVQKTLRPYGSAAAPVWRFEVG